MVYFFQFFTHFQCVFVARTRLFFLYTKFSVKRMRFLVSACTSLLLAVNQYNEFTGIFLRFQTKELVLRVIKRKITGESTFNADPLGIECNHGLTKYEKTLLGVFFQNYANCLNAKTPKHVHLRFSSIFSVFQFFTHSGIALEGRSKLILF